MTTLNLANYSLLYIQYVRPLGVITNRYFEVAHFTLLS